MSPRVLLPLLLVLVSASVVGNPREELFFQSNRLYEDGNYHKALESYQSIVTLGYESGALYFNIGNCNYKLGKIGKAILNYERARRFIPGDEDLKVNLALARLKVVDRIPQLPRFWLFALLERSLFSVSRTFLLIVIWFSYFFLMGSLVLKLLWNRGDWVSGKILWASSLLLVGGLLCFIVQIRQARESTEAIILAREVRAVSAPGEEGVQVFTLHEGTKVRIQEISGSWVEVLLADGNVGWLKTDSMARVVSAD